MGVFGAIMVDVIDGQNPSRMGLVVCWLLSLEGLRRHPLGGQDILSGLCGDKHERHKRLLSWVNGRRLLTMDNFFFPNAHLIVHKTMSLHDVTKPHQFPAHSLKEIFLQDTLRRSWRLTSV